MFDTRSLFSNQDEDKIIIFGIVESDDDAVKGVYNAQDLQKKLTEQCKQMKPSVRALFTFENIKLNIIDEKRMESYLYAVKSECKNLSIYYNHRQSI